MKRKFAELLLTMSDLRLYHLEEEFLTIKDEFIVGTSHKSFKIELW